MTLTDIARVCHQVNKAYCESLGDITQKDWDAAPDWQRQSAIDGVAFHMNNPLAGPKASHENWLRLKEKEGWKYGPVKDEAKKEHPCMVPYDELPQEQKSKDYIFCAIVRCYEEA